MTALTWPWTRRRPKPWIRHNRADQERMIRALSLQRDLAKGEARATVEWVASWLASTADRYQRSGHSPIADELRALITELDESR